MKEGWPGQAAAAVVFVAAVAAVLLAAVEGFAKLRPLWDLHQRMGFAWPG